ncbi:DUF3347 domain-containing protein [Niabella beijingensis]|uniref:DUF3347 domain-containing protein n=1 Tax=Niabella beijingensis TaxID=2872700 RepID=UPI001CC0E01E|nr:DUF3347 domain-containing protein [Niabella beijingensis]MBZ4187536.1 DUF3347 domain-containing protein [Niabella beijingensis]
MKQLFLWGWIVIALAACNAPGSTNSGTAADSVNQKAATTPQDTAAKQAFSADGILNAYFALGTALFEEQPAGITDAATMLGEKLKVRHTSALPAAQQKEIQEIIEASVENAEHIAASRDKPGHQREHFQLLSDDLYDLVKTAGTGKVIYKFVCPASKDKKETSWLSDQQLVKNPYTGAAHTDCGNITETIK